MIAVIGSNMVDLVTYIDRMPVLGETLEAPNFQIGCGGKGANQAVAAALMGTKVLMVTRVGDDIFADNTIRNFKVHGIDTTYVKKVPNTSSGVAPIFVDKSAQNSILIIKGANNHLTPASIDEAAESIKKCSLILLQLEVSLETVYYAIEFGKKNGIPVLLNPAPANTELDIEKVCDCEFFMPNETELMTLTGLPVDTLEQVDTAARVLVDKGLTNVIVTLGSRGSLWVHKDGTNHIEAIKVDAVDTSGAGDSYIGCFAAIYEESKDVLKAMQAANIYAALGVQNKGTQASYPTKVAYEEFAAKVGG